MYIAIWITTVHYTAQITKQAIADTTDNINQASKLYTYVAIVNTYTCMETANYL